MRKEEDDWKEHATASCMGLGREDRSLLPLFIPTDLVSVGQGTLPSSHSHGSCCPCGHGFNTTLMLWCYLIVLGVSVRLSSGLTVPSCHITL